MIASLSTSASASASIDVWAFSCVGSNDLTAAEIDLLCMAGHVTDGGGQIDELVNVDVRRFSGHLDAALLLSGC